MWNANVWLVVGKGLGGAWHDDGSRRALCVLAKGIGALEAWQLRRLDWVEGFLALGGHRQATNLAAGRADYLL